MNQRLYFAFVTLTERLANIYPNCAVYDGIFVCGESDDEVILEDIAALDVDSGDTKEDTDADKLVTVADEDPGTPLEDPKAEERRLARIAARKAARIAARVEERVQARIEARKAIRMLSVEGNLADLKNIAHPMVAMQVSRAQGKHLFKPAVTEEI